MGKRQTQTTPSPYKLFNCDVLNILASCLKNNYFLIFLDLYNQQDIEDFMNKAVRMDAVLNIPSPYGRQSFFPYVKNVQELKAEYKQQQWDFSCVVFDEAVNSLLYIRGIEENGENGLHITETEDGLYNKLIGKA